MTGGAKKLVNGFGAVLLGCGLAQAGEQVQFKGSTSVELPKPKRPIENSRRLISEPEAPALDGGFLAPPPSDSSPLNDRKLREALDKKKNWIFMNPYEQQFDTKTEEFMKGERGTGLYDHRLMSPDEEKTMVQKFLEEKDQRSRDGNNAEDNLPDRTRDNDKLNGPDDENRELKENSNILLPGGKFSFETPVFQSGFSDGAVSASFEKRLDMKSIGENPFAPGRGKLSSFEKEELKQQQIAHEREFDQILQNRLGGLGQAPGLGRLNPVTTVNPIGQLDLGGTVGSRPDSLNLGRIGGSVPTTATFTDGGASFGGGRPTFEAPTGFGGGISAPVAKPANPFVPPVQQAPVARGPSFSPSPFNMTIPKRSF